MADSKYSKLDETHQDSERAPLSEASSDTFHDEPLDPEDSLSRKRRAGRCQRPLQTLGLVLSSAVFFAIGFLSHSQLQEVDERACIDTAWDALREPDAVRFETQHFNPRFTGAPSPYMGPPNEQVDKLWYDLSELRNFGVGRSTLESMNRSRGAVEFMKDGEHTGLFEAGMEVFHQLHCLNYVRMYSYMDYYEAIDFDMLAESAEKRQEHKDHCIETLRQSLMCHPDLNIYSYHWVSRHDQAWANLESRHRCVDWDHFHDWAQSNLMTYYPPKTRPEGVEVWE
ncbi:uncharacterized protein PG986_008687 [Apiospora aurea]|uniref:Cyclochlorotine biosynthesis protein O n=1 Tax=Apiospora aurea TaxID=335848 RepID=A0ABR1Q6U6_9PEZI